MNIYHKSWNSKRKQKEETDPRNEIRIRYKLNQSYNPKLLILNFHGSYFILICNCKYSADFVGCRRKSEKNI